MAAMLLKDVPPRLKKQIQTQAHKNRRSMNREAMVLLEEALRQRRPVRLPKPLKTRRPMDHEWLLKTTKEGRS